MICPKCKSAAASAALVQGPVPADLAQSLLRRAIKLHQQCKGGTWCDCQHRIPARKATGDATKPGTQA